MLHKIILFSLGICINGCDAQKKAKADLKPLKWQPIQNLMSKRMISSI
jgi:hypothetical protein